MRRDEKFGRGAYAFFADNTACVERQVFNARLNEAIILHGAAGVADVWTVVNSNVSSRLDGDDGTELFRQGLVFVLRRDTAPSFEVMFDGLLAKATHGVAEIQRPYVQRLDTTATETAVTWIFSDVRAAYMAASDVLLTEQVLEALGVTSEGAALIVAEYERAKIAYRDCADPEQAKTLDPYTNTWVFDRVSEKGAKRLEGLSVEDGNKAWNAARTMYMFNIPSLMELAVAAQDGFDGTAALKVLRRHMKPSADLMVTSADISEDGAFKAALGDVRVAWLFSDVIGTLTAEELTAATRVQHATEYHVARNAFLASPDPANWLVLVGAMTTYLTNAADEIIRLRTRRGAFQDPANVGVSLIGNAAGLRMESSAGDGVEMAGLPANFQADPVQVVARHIEVPAFDRSATV